MGYRLDKKVFWQPASELVTFSHFLAAVRPFLHISSDILDNLQKAEPICFPLIFLKSSPTIILVSWRENQFEFL